MINQELLEKRDSSYYEKYFIEAEKKSGLMEEDIIRGIGVPPYTYYGIRRGKTCSKELVERIHLFFGAQGVILDERAFPDRREKYEVPLDYSLSLHERTISPEDSIEMNIMLEDKKIAIKIALLRLRSRREEDIIRKYFGIGTVKKTLEEIGREYKLTRERIRQIKEKAIHRLRYSKMTKELRLYL